jgi:hypothetical protein
MELAENRFATRSVWRQAARGNIGPCFSLPGLRAQVQTEETMLRNADAQSAASSIPSSSPDPVLLDHCIFYYGTVNYTSLNTLSLAEKIFQCDDKSLFFFTFYRDCL